MTKNPFYNALAALIYIIFVASVMFFGIENIGPSKSIIIPVLVLSVFTLSAAVMGYIFLSQPIQLYLDSKKKEALKLFLQTVVAFAAITAVLLVVLLSKIIPI